MVHLRASLQRVFLTAAILICLMAVPAQVAGADQRSEFFCNEAAKHFAAFLPPSPARQTNSGLCELGSLAGGQLAIYFPTLGTDSLDRERIVTRALNKKPVDEPDLGEGAFSIHNDGLMDSNRVKYYAVQYYARKNAQIFSIEFSRYRPFAEADFAAARAAIKAFFDDLE